MMTGREGVTKYRLSFTPAPLPQPDRIRELNAWRSIIRMLGLNGLDPGRYGGLAYGNVSLRLPNDGVRFLISGTQTGGRMHLTADDYCEVRDFDLETNRLEALGPIPPSSEALTHAAVYRADPAWRCVMHAHSPEIWRHARALGLRATDPEIEYGTPAMALAVEALAARPGVPLIAMLGHSDGVIAYGGTVETTARILISYLAEALQLDDYSSAPGQPATTSQLGTTP
ncbi:MULTISPECIES: class II aldolase/adducin family protein [Methylococcus]|uniref:Class II aldolase/adducin family protein n=1 Tax=Methylococcus capsulatus TaxID=414 RepID=A0ABZ2F4V2_METCP|nr:MULTISPECIES: class II aldolase/adducin family protein [Methylococcus]MDF9393339.1 class II aldolase/adducin family protein [Methylococcus capsulatus]